MSALSPSSSLGSAGPRDLDLGPLSPLFPGRLIGSRDVAKSCKAKGWECKWQEESKQEKKLEKSPGE